jgi:hypothetical protein
MTMIVTSVDTKAPALQKWLQKKVPDEAAFLCVYRPTAKSAALLIA